MTRRFDWRIWLIVWLGTIVGLVAIVPYSLALQSLTLERLAAISPLPVPQLLAVQLGSQALLFGALAAVGLWLGGRIGTGLPLVRALLERNAIDRSWRSWFLLAIILGIAASLLIIALDSFIFSPLLQEQLGNAAQGLQAGRARPAWWQGLLASFYGGIDEEVLLRLFLLTLLAFLGKFISHTPDGRPTMAIFWIANVVAAVMFGLGHLPATAALIPLTPLVVVRAVVLNGLAGLVFGYLYFARGLETAMLSHFSADIVLHDILAM